MEQWHEHNGLCEMSKVHTHINRLLPIPWPNIMHATGLMRPMSPVLAHSRHAQSLDSASIEGHAQGCSHDAALSCKQLEDYALIYDKAWRNSKVEWRLSERAGCYCFQCCAWSVESLLADVLGLMLPVGV